MKPRFITLGDTDDVGKPTNLAVMKAWSEKHKLPILFTREPGGMPAGETLCEVLPNSAAQVSLRIETLLMFVVRQQHLETVILPVLENGTHVASDRLTDATFIYQGDGRGVPLQDTATLEYWAQGDFRPNLTLLLDVPSGASMARINQTCEKDRLEQEAAEFFNRMWEVYLQRAAKQPERYAVIDSGQSSDTVETQIETALDSHFGLNV